MLNSAERSVLLSCFSVKVLGVAVCEFCEMIVAICLFRGLKVAKSGMNARFRCR